MGCPEFCAILSFIGTIFLSILGVLVASGTKFLDWDIKETRNQTKSSLFVAAGVYFGFFILSMVYKSRKDARLAEESAYKNERRRLISGDDDVDANVNQRNPFSIN